MRRVLGASERPHGIDVSPAWMTSAARLTGPAIPDAQGVSMGAIRVSDIVALNEVTAARTAAANEAATIAEIGNFLATQQIVWPDEIL